MGEVANEIVPESSRLELEADVDAFKDERLGKRFGMVLTQLAEGTAEGRPKTRQVLIVDKVAVWRA